MKVYRYLIPFIALLILAVPALADVTTMLTLDGVPADVVCGQVWQENQVDLSFVPTTGEDCAEGNCYFGTDVDGVWLYPCRLLVDFGQSYNVISVEIDWADYCGVGCTNAFLYNGGATVASARSNSAVCFWSSCSPLSISRALRYSSLSQKLTFTFPFIIFLSRHSPL